MDKRYMVAHLDLKVSVAIKRILPESINFEIRT